MRVWARAGDWGPRYTTAVCHHPCSQSPPCSGHLDTPSPAPELIALQLYIVSTADMLLPWQSMTLFACAGPNQYPQETPLLRWESVGQFWLVYKEHGPFASKWIPNTCGSDWKWLLCPTSTSLYLYHPSLLVTGCWIITSSSHPNIGALDTIHIHPSTQSSGDSQYNILGAVSLLCNQL